MNKTIIMCLALCVGAAAFGGSKFNGNGNVTIVRNADGSGSASGFLGMIYNGPAMKQWIGCQRSESDNVFCHALDETGTVPVGCSVKSAFLAKSISSISPDVRLSFIWNAQGVCTRIQVTHSSEYQDKQG